MIKESRIENENQQYNENQEEVDMCNIPDGIIKSLKDDISEIKTALLGSKYQQKGLIERVEHLEYQVENLKSMKYKIYGGAIVLATIVSALFRIVIKFV